MNTRVAGCAKRQAFDQAINLVFRFAQKGE
jgi:hypothetical protein